MAMSCCSGKERGNRDSAYSWGGGTPWEVEVPSLWKDFQFWSREWLAVLQGAWEELSTNCWLSSGGLQGHRGKLGVLPIFSSVVNLYFDKRWAFSSSELLRVLLQGA